MTDLNQAIRSRLEALADWDDITLMHAALLAVLDELIVATPGAHLVDWDRGRLDLSESARKAIAKALGVEADGG